MNIIEGQLIAQDLKIAIVVARFNEFIGSKLVAISSSVAMAVT